MKASYTITKFNGEWACWFMLNGHADLDAYGTSGTGVKVYGSKDKAENAGKRYLNKMKKNGFEC